MLRFYRNAAFACVAVTVLTAFIVYCGFMKSRVSTSLFPERDSAFPWAPAIEPSSPTGKTQLSVKSDVGTIDYAFVLDPDEPFAYTHYSFYFIQPQQPYKVVDLSGYNQMSFRILCDPRNVFLFVLFSLDDKVTDPLRPVTRRVSSTAFSCDKAWQTVTINFDELATPHWWLDRYGFEFSDQGYPLSQTMGFAIVNSLQSPLDTLSTVRLTDVTMKGWAPRYLYFSAVIGVMLWVTLIVWVMRQYVTFLTIKLREKVRLDQPLMAYKKLSLEPQKDKEKSHLLRYMATEYANSDLSLEATATLLGINRTKINEILKEELGLTFSTYLKKLRLTEAARLLSENPDTNISQVAYRVGYNNVSYFNRVFKAEYSCTPKTFQSLCQSEGSTANE